MGATDAGLARNPFAPGNDEAYARWRDRKLAARARSAADLLVEVRDPRALTAAEKAEIVRRCRRDNMAVYASTVTGEDKSVPRRLGAQLGLATLDTNFLADEDGITSIAVTGAKASAGFIPYTTHRIRWHTDGYYNPPELRIRAMLLHCVRDAASGGDTAVLDHELAYLLLREDDPALAWALMQPDALAIPARVDEEGVARPAAVGPVFSVEPGTGDLHMRYTARTRSVAWKDDPATAAAAARLLALLDGDSGCVLRTRLLPGMGLVCNNVLHERSAFVDDPARPRLLYRARYVERIAGTEGAWAVNETAGV
ncbi:MAG: TauD/TfdA family dioxygenase [Betaproteobacteria bacterium]|nr:TauD/TfdA family dioxygenase [Betaproteobacteria bacterium]PWB58701.1 MAG: taurine catabolism dioxygenase TauD [Betaproteobacteria bacterium]